MQNKRRSPLVGSLGVGAILLGSLALISDSSHLKSIGELVGAVVVGLGIATLVIVLGRRR